MAKRKAKKRTQPKGNEKEVEGAQSDKMKVAKELCDFSTHEVARRIAAIEAIRDQEIENLLTQMRLLRSCLTKEQLETNGLDFFKENFPNLSVTKNEKDMEFELEWKVKEPQCPIDGPDMYPGSSFSLPQMGGFGFSSKSVEMKFLQAAGVHISDLVGLLRSVIIQILKFQHQVLDEIPETQAGGSKHAFQTPGATNQKLAVGITPMSQRLPKNGEMLLSVHGSPLGVYKEDSMDTIEESGEN